jgi:hypothetical protein
MKKKDRDDNRFFPTVNPMKTVVAWGKRKRAVAALNNVVAFVDMQGRKEIKEVNNTSGKCNRSGRSGRNTRGTRGNRRRDQPNDPESFM